jgi:hypothetical protein
VVAEGAASVTETVFNAGSDPADKENFEVHSRSVPVEVSVGDGSLHLFSFCVPKALCIYIYLMNNELHT